MSRPEAAAQGGSARVAYMLKRYPRYSETFIVNEILAHEAAGTELRIFSLYPPSNTHFQDAISRVRAPVTYLGSVRPRVTDLWGLLLEAQALGLPVGAFLASAQSAQEDARNACWALDLALEVKKQNITHMHAHFASGATTVARLAALLALARSGERNPERAAPEPLLRDLLGSLLPEARASRIARRSGSACASPTPT